MTLAPGAAHGAVLGLGLRSVRGQHAPLGVLGALHGLELRERHDVAALGPVPDGAAPHRVVVVEASAVGVEQLPPLVAVGLSHGGAQRRLPAALPRRQVDVHALPRARLQDFYPIRAEEREERERRLRRSRGVYSNSPKCVCFSFKLNNRSISQQACYVVVARRFWDVVMWYD